MEIWQYAILAIVIGALGACVGAIVWMIDLLMSMAFARITNEENHGQDPHH